MTTSLDKLHGTVAVQKDSTLSSYASVNLDKLHATVAIQKDSTLSSYASVNLDKLHATAAIRVPWPGVGTASGRGRTLGQSEFVQALRPASDTSIGTWKNEVNGTTSLFQSVAKPAGVDDGTFVVATASAVNDTVKFKLDVPVFEVGDEGYVDYRIAKAPSTATQTVNITVRLLQGVTEIAAWVHTNVSGTLTNVTQTLTAPQIAAITDYSNLYLEIISQPQ